MPRSKRHRDGPRPSAPAELAPEDRWKWGLPYLPNPLPRRWRVTRADAVVVIVDVDRALTFGIGGLTNAEGYDLVALHVMARGRAPTDADVSSIVARFPSLSFEEEHDARSARVRSFVAFVAIDPETGLASSEVASRAHLRVMESARSLLKQALSRALLEARSLRDYAIVLQSDGDGLVLRRDEVESSLVGEGDPDRVRALLDTALDDHTILVLVVRRGVVHGMQLEWAPDRIDEVLR